MISSQFDFFLRQISFNRWGHCGGGGGSLRSAGDSLLRPRQSPGGGGGEPPAEARGERPFRPWQIGIERNIDYPMITYM